MQSVSKLVILLLVIPFALAPAGCKDEPAAPAAADPPAASSAPADAPPAPAPKPEAAIPPAPPLPEKVDLAAFWKWIGIDVSDARVVEKKPDQVVVENAELGVEDLAKKVAGELVAAGWKDEDFDEGQYSLLHELLRGGLQLYIDGKKNADPPTRVKVYLAQYWKAFDPVFEGAMMEAGQAQSYSATFEAGVIAMDKLYAKGREALEQHGWRKDRDEDLGPLPEFVKVARSTVFRRDLRELTLTVHTQKDGMVLIKLSVEWLEQKAERKAEG